MTRRSIGVRFAALSIVACTMTFAGGARADAPSSGVRGTEAKATATALSVLLEQLRSRERNMRRAAARSIESLGPEGTAAMAAELARGRPGRPSAEVSALLARVGDVPDAGEDRLDAVLDLSPDVGGPAYAETITTLCLVRALAHAGNPEAVAALAEVALDARGAFLPDVQRHLAALGERATAGLVLMNHAAGKNGIAATPESRWASAELEALGKRTPGDAVQTKSKDVLADVLLAYGTVTDEDALPVVLSFINADKKLVRDAARESLIRYGDRALPRLREAYGLLLGEPAPSDWPLPWLRRKLFEALDRVRLQDVDARVRDGLALAEAGKFQEAVADFDDVLARQPDWDKKAELVPAYVFDAQSLLDSDPMRARELFEKALWLDPDGPRAPQAKSALATLEGDALVARGIADEGPFRRALALDPANTRAADAIGRLEVDARGRKKAWDRRVMSAAAVVAILSVVVLFSAPRRRRV